MAKTIDFSKFYNIVNNEKLGSESVSHSIDPTTKQPLWKHPLATKDDLDTAVDASNKAFKSWATVPEEERGQLLRTFADLLNSYADEMTQLLHRETGKSLDFARGEIMIAIGTTRANSNWSVPDQVLKDTDEVKVVVQHVPYGVVGGITPWNYPVQMAILKLAPAVKAGCTTIIKPSPFTPYTTLKIAEIAAQVFPPGVVQALAGDDSLGPWMTAHPGIAKISFTGSIPTGKRIMAAASETLKRVNLEMGGNDAAIVTEDFDVRQAAQLMAPATFAHSGQICMATKRVYVHKSVYEEFMAEYVAIAKTLKAGEGYCSPIQNQMQYEKVLSVYEDCGQNGFNFAVGGPSQDTRDGYFVEPAIISEPPEKSRVVQEEVFGPIIPVMSFESDDDVIQRVNDHPTGLGGIVYCQDETRAWSIASALETGSVWVNGGLKLDPVAFFGAHKQSGIGGELGPLGMALYTNTRCVTYWKTQGANTAIKGQGKGEMFSS